MQKRLFLLVVTLLTLSLSAVAQITTSSMAGKVTFDDANGEEVIGATVVALHEPSGTRYTAVTNASGLFTIQGFLTQNASIPPTAIPTECRLEQAPPWRKESKESGIATLSTINVVSNLCKTLISICGNFTKTIITWRTTIFSFFCKKIPKKQIFGLIFVTMCQILTISLKLFIKKPMVCGYCNMCVPKTSKTQTRKKLHCTTTCSLGVQKTSPLGFHRIVGCPLALSNKSICCGTCFLKKNNHYEKNILNQRKGILNNNAMTIKMHIQHGFLSDLIQKWIFHTNYCRFCCKNSIL